MYLEKFTIKNFRSINELELKFNKGLNILIGENNSGKTAIIDALRICFSLGKQWRDVGIRNDEDFYIDVSEIKDEQEPIEFDLYFKVEKRKDRNIFNDLISQNPKDPTSQTIQMHFRYRLETKEKGNKVLRWTIWGGDLEGQTVSSNVTQEIFYSYLAPLRDAEYELRPYVRQNKLASLFRELTKYKKSNGEKSIEEDLTQEKKKELAKKLDDVIRDPDWSGLIKTGETYINEHLENADISNKESRVNLRLSEYNYENIIKSVLARKPVYDDNLLKGDNTKQRFFDVSQNGLGENNLIYASAVLGDLKNRRKEQVEHYYALLIEEPEAHLHPQKQNTFFEYLNTLQDLGIQLFITSHSPTITAKSNLDNIIVMQKQENTISAFALINSSLSIKNKSYLHKFLDVTKSQLFFSNGSILVEGISEALLLPIFSRILGDELALDKNGIEIVNINGVSFEPFAKLYNNADVNSRLPSKCAILTDGDEHRNSGKITERAQNVKNLKYANLDVQIAHNTFEYELVCTSRRNSDVIKDVYESMHKRTKLKSGENLNERAIELLDKLDQNKDKSELAQNLAYKLDYNTESRENFDVPSYIEKAIKWVVNK
jgi:putative ATP-dependent endonuclease of OLD family